VQRLAHSGADPITSVIDGEAVAQHQVEHGIGAQKRRIVLCDDTAQRRGDPLLQRKGVVALTLLP
jgi:hypothetical protein